MRRIQILFQAVIVITLFASSLTMSVPTVAQADSANASSLVISQLKITSSNGQFITLYNASNTALDMSRYQLEYFNNYDLTKATSSKLIALSGMVPPHGYFMVNDGSLLLCYQLTIDSVSLDLSSTAGLVEVLSFNQSNPGGSVAPTLQDFVGWSKTTSGGAAQTLSSNTNAFLERQPTDNQNNPAITTPGSGSWQTVQPASDNACNVVNSASGMVMSIGLNELLPPTEPPATIVTLNNDDATGATTAANLPASDIGLMGPQVNEILPNPNGTGNDATDEFVELYNPNEVGFDLSGFALQVGTSSLHTYTFPAGTNLPPHGFTAFYSANTGLSLSNSGGQVKLLDSLGSSISASDVYGVAKDGQTWALAKGKWYWTTDPTPNAANIIKQPASSKKSTTKSAAKKSTTKSTKTAKATKSQALADQNASADTPSTTPIHLWVLALVATLALLYGLYEYRADLANHLYQLRRYLKARGSGRS